MLCSFFLDGFIMATRTSSDCVWPARWPNLLAIAIFTCCLCSVGKAEDEQSRAELRLMREMFVPGQRVLVLAEYPTLQLLNLETRRNERKEIRGIGKQYRIWTLTDKQSELLPDYREKLVEREAVSKQLAPLETTYEKDRGRYRRDVNRFFQRRDLNRNGLIEQEEWTDVSVSFIRGRERESRVTTMDDFDRDDDGVLTEHEVAELIYAATFSSDRPNLLVINGEGFRKYREEERLLAADTERKELTRKLEIVEQQIESLKKKLPDGIPKVGGTREIASTNAEFVTFRDGDIERMIPISKIQEVRQRVSGEASQTAPKASNDLNGDEVFQPGHFVFIGSTSVTLLTPKQQQQLHESREEHYNEILRYRQRKDELEKKVYEHLYLLSQARVFVAICDTDKSGVLDKEEWGKEKGKWVKEHADLFKDLDIDSNGAVSVTEVFAFIKFGKGPMASEGERILREYEDAAAKLTTFVKQESPKLLEWQQLEKELVGAHLHWQGKRGTPPHTGKRQILFGLPKWRR